MMRTLIFALTMAATAAIARANDLAFDVLSYDVRLKPDFATQSASGQTIIRFKSTANGLTALSFSANTLDVVASLDGEHIVSSELNGDRRLFRLPRPMRKGDVGRLVVTFKGKAPKGLVWTRDTVYANYFTCDYMICDQDRPGDKAMVKFDVSVPRDMVVISPRTTRRPFSAYLLGFAAGRFNGFALVPTRPSAAFWLQENQPEAIKDKILGPTLDMMAFFEERSGVRFPNPAYTQVLVEGGEAQEAASHAIIGLDNIAPILENPHEDWVIAHELAHQWWGNAVTCADWSELWLNEGLTVFMVAAWKEHRWGRADYDRELDLANKRWDAAKQQGFDVPLSWQGKYPSLRLKRAMAYAKAVVFLDMLRRELGEDAFWRAIKTYTRTHWDGIVRAQDLQRAFERSAKRDLSALFRKWVYGEV